MLNRSSIAVWGKKFSLLQNDSNGYRAHPPFYAMGTDVPFQGLKRTGRKDNQLHLVTKLMSGDNPSWQVQGKFVPLPMSQSSR
jgi:hypothetical protein